MTDPGIQAQKQYEAALGQATWSPVAGFPDIEAAEVTGQMSARRIGTTSPVLGFSSGDWEKIVATDPDLVDPDLVSILQQLTGSQTQ